MHKLQLLLDRAVEQGLFSGVALGVASMNQPELGLFAGTTSLDTNAPVLDASSYFDLASLTKVFATTYIMSDLVISKKIDIRETLGSDIFNLKLSSFLAQTSIAHILSHQSGFPAWIDFSSLKNVKDLPCGSDQIKDAFMDILNRLKPEYEPGSKTLYSDLGFILLRFFLEQKFKTPFQNLFQSLLSRIQPDIEICFLPLNAGVSLSSIVSTELRPWRSEVALKGQVHDDNTYLLGGVSTHAGLFGTLPATLKMAQEWLKGYYGQSEVFSKEHCREWSLRQRAKDQSEWARGWDVPSNKGSSAGDLISSQSVGHLGYTGTSVWIDLEKKLLVVLLSNRVHPQDTHKIEMREFRRKIHDSVWSMT